MLFFNIPYQIFCIFKSKSFLLLQILIFTVFSQIIYAQPDGYLKQGTFAINPEDERTLFLYIPAKTLLYSLKPDKACIGSEAFPDRQLEYQKAITQDGIEALIWDKVINTNADIVDRYDFFVNRRLPLCLTPESCEEIWKKFNLISDEGEGWRAIWPGSGGKFREKVGNIQKVRIDAGGWEDGYMPAKCGGFSIEDCGYISKTNRAYPLYRYTTKKMTELSTQCGQTVIEKDKIKIYSKVEAYGRLSADLSLDPTSIVTKYIPKKYAKKLLEMFGLEANIGVEGFIDGSWKRTNESDETRTIKYGNENESWVVKDILVDKRTISELGTDSDYKPYGRVLIKKVYVCRSNEQVDLNYISFLISFYDQSGKQKGSIIHISLDKNNLPQEFKLKNTPRPKALISVGERADHFKIIEFFLREGIPKSIGSLFISELNRSGSK